MGRKKSKKHKKKVKKSKEYYLLKTASVKMFGKLIDKYSGHFESLRTSLYKADMKILFRTYLSMVFFLTFFIFILTFLLTLAFSLYFNLNILLVLTGLIIVPSLFAAVTFFLYYTYPVSLAEKRKRNIDSNLPFAINHMAAIAGSGVPPRVMFKIVSRFKDYGEVSREANKIYRNIEVFGLDEVTAIKEVSEKTPSQAFKDFLQGIITTIQTGGSLNNFLKQGAEKAMFDYRIKRNKYIQQLSIYADFYTALLIAAPLVFVILLPILSIMKGTVFGFGIYDLVKIGLALLTTLNTGFLVFLHLTQPEV